MSNNEISEQGTSNPDLAFRLSVESQLLSEEKWLVEALKKIQKQRNNLQIERLNLISAQHKIASEKYSDKEKPISIPSPSKDVVSLMHTLPSTHQEMAINIDGDICNGEELNLTVPQHNFQPEVEDDVDFDDFEMEMNMFMNGFSSSDNQVDNICY